MTGSAKKPELVEVTLTCEYYTHNGGSCKKGDKIKVTSGQADWMKKQGVIS